MISRMQPKYYLSKEIFDLERKRIFSKLWLFAGIKQMLLEHNSFLTRDVAGIPVVIQNFEGRIRAFENTCLHRSAKIQWEAFGRRPLLCRYHGWGYASDGSVQNIPFEKEIYQFPTEERRCLKLREFAVELVGGVIFINLATDPIPITDQFSAAFLETLSSSSNAYDTEVMHTTLNGKFNWKLAYENLRDSNHVRFVHAQSLAKYVAFESTVDPVASAKAREPFPETKSSSGMCEELRQLSFGGPDSQVSNLRKFKWHESINRFGDADDYYNWLAYPNMHASSADGGYSFIIEHHIPISADQTDVEVYRFTARKRQSYSYSHQVLLTQMHGHKIILDEDIKIMEMVQAGLHGGAPPAQQGEYEVMNKIVERWYAAMMEAKDDLV
jgi:carnitine monooxygenase subunit